MNKTFLLVSTQQKAAAVETCQRAQRISSVSLSVCLSVGRSTASCNQASNAHMMYDTSQHAELHSYITQSFCHLGGAVKTTSALAENARGE